MSRSEPRIAFSFRCDQRWSDLEPRRGGRHCDKCERTVIDLGTLTRAQAVEAAKRGECGRLRLDVDGRALFRTPPARRPGLRALTVISGLAAGCAGAPNARLEAEPAVSAEPAVASSMDPMRPIPEGVAFAELDEGAAAALDEALTTEVVPTAEQRALTARKSRRRAPQYGYARPMGVMVCPTPTLPGGTPTF